MMKPSNVARRTRPKAAPLPGSARRLASPGKKLEAALHGRVDSGLPEPSKPKVAPRHARQPKQEATQGISRRPVAVETTRAQRGPLALEAKLAEREAAVRAELRAGREALEAELKTVK